MRLFLDFKKHHSIVYRSGYISLLYIMVCVLLKMSTEINISCMWVYVIGESLLNVAYSILAADIFFFFQDYYSHYKVMKIKEKYFLENRKQIADKINIFLDILEKLYDGEPEENRENNLFYALINIEGFINQSFDLYIEVIDDDLFDHMNSVMNNSLFLYIKKRLENKIIGETIQNLLLCNKKDYETLIRSLKEIVIYGK